MTGSQFSLKHVASNKKLTKKTKKIRNKVRKSVKGSPVVPTGWITGINILSLERISENSN